jgi:hypothetical protein
MKIEEAVSLAVLHSQKCGASAPRSVRDNWEKFSFSASAIEALAQEGLTVRVAAELRNPMQREEVEPMRVNIVSRSDGNTQPTFIHVRILRDTVLDTAGGIRKALIDFTQSDCRCYIEQQEAQKVGIERHIHVMEHIRARLQKCGKKRVVDLAQGEQEIIARMWEAARNGRDSDAFDRFRDPVQPHTAVSAD